MSVTVSACEIHELVRQLTDVRSGHDPLAHLSQAMERPDDGRGDHVSPDEADNEGRPLVH